MAVPEATRNKARLVILGLVFVGFHLAGWLFPDTWWGAHSLAFIPLTWSCLFAALLIAILLFAEHIPIGKLSLTDARRFRKLAGGLLLPILMASAMGFAFYRFPLAMDAFGDAIRFEQYFRGPHAEFNPESMRAILDWNIFHARNGERTVLNAMHFLSAQSGRPPREMFRLMTAICGGMYALLALWFVRAYGGLFLQKMVNLCLLLLAPFLWIFFGHMEIYAPAILLATAYGVALLLFLNKPSALWLPGLLLLLYLSIKAHTVNYHFTLVFSIYDHMFSIDQKFARGFCFFNKAARPSRRFPHNDLSRQLLLL